MTTMTIKTAAPTVDLERGFDVMEMLRQGIPLTLLLDLVDPFGPRSAEIYHCEGQAESAA